MKISAIFSLTAIKNNEHIYAFGNKGDLVTRDSEDLKRFKELTGDSPLIMGRKTFESMGCKALPNRKSIIITTSCVNIWHKDCLWVSSLEEAIDAAEKLLAKECFIIGGSSILLTAINNYCSTIYITYFDAAIDRSECDVTMDISDIDWGKYYSQSTDTHKLKYQVYHRSINSLAVSPS